MRNARQALRPSETALIIQGRIEGLTPQQVLICDEFVADGVPREIASEFMKMDADFRKDGALELEQHLRARGASDEVIQYLVSRTVRAFSEAIAEQLPAA